MDKQQLKNYAQRVKEETSGLDRRIRARVAGVTFEGRQEHLAKLSEDTEVRLERDRRNPYDFHAVKVMAHLGEWIHVGFIPRPMSRLIANSLDAGEGLNATVARIKGGFESEYTGEQLSYGLEIDIIPERL